MAITASALAAELGAYNRANNKEIRQMAYQKSVSAGFMRTIPSIKGKFPALQSITGHVVQGFTDVWSALGLTEFKVNPLVNYRQKVNYPIKPTNVEGTWIAHLYEENKKPQDMAISKYVIEKELMPKVVADREYLLCRGVYDANNLNVFGKSMNGIAEIIRLGMLDGSENPVFQVPIDAFTVGNISEQVEGFELAIPDVLKALVNKIYMSTTNVEKYRLDFFKKYGSYPSFVPGENGYRTVVGNRLIVGLPGLNGTDTIFATPDENFLRLIDINDEPVITDVQVQDYEVKIFMEWDEGAAFWTNQMVIAGKVGGTVTGLQPAGQNEKYFGQPAVATA